jgi:hypothetical protein
MADMINDLVVHRGNSLVNMLSPIKQVGYYVDAGFKKIEIDIYAISESTYKFCHPMDSNNVTETHNLYDGFLNDLVKQYPPHTEWYVDLKCLDLDNAPRVMMQYIADTFGKSAVFTAAQHEILDFMYQRGMCTAQYFKDGIDPRLDHEPDFYIQSASGDLSDQKRKTIVYCPTAASALSYLSEGFAGGMVDGRLLITSNIDSKA